MSETQHDQRLGRVGTRERAGGLAATLPGGGAPSAVKFDACSARVGGVGAGLPPTTGRDSGATRRGGLDFGVIRKPP
jgi:hypothetical protein